MISITAVIFLNIESVRFKNLHKMVNCTYTFPSSNARFGRNMRNVGLDMDLSLRYVSLNTGAREGSRSPKRRPPL